MYFFKKEGRQYLDLTGNLILSHNDQLVKARVKSAAPTKVLNAQYAVNVKQLNFRNKLKLIWMIYKFIFGPSQALTSQITNKQ